MEREAVSWLNQSLSHLFGTRIIEHTMNAAQTMDVADRAGQQLDGRDTWLKIATMCADLVL